jgi:hypothetical protein
MITMILTDGLRYQAIAQLCAFCSPKSGSVSAIAMFRQQQGLHRNDL